MTRSLLRGALAGVICAAAVCAVSLFDSTLFDSEWLLRDAFTRSIAAKRKPDPRIVLVTVSDESINILSQLNWGRPPYPRSIYARLIEELRRAGASVIAFDILFAEEDAARPDADREFASALGGAPTVLAAYAGASTWRSRHRPAASGSATTWARRSARSHTTSSSTPA